MMKAKFARLVALNEASRARLGRAAVGVAALAGSAGAFALPTAFTLDSSPIVDVIASAVTTISAIGMAVLSLVVVIKLFKWVQRVL